MRVNAALSEDGEKIYLLFYEEGKEDPEDVIGIQFTLEETKIFLALVYDALKEAQGVQDLVAMGFGRNGN